jgi:putative permease
MNYAILLGVLVGLSVIIPYIGAVVVTIPVFVVALMQWGTEPYFLYLIIAYAVIIVLDANILVPLFFSETIVFHPVVIILSVLVFGGIWGFWGVFFAIPLATAADAMLRAWPKTV